MIKLVLSHTTMIIKGGGGPASERSGSFVMMAREKFVRYHDHVKEVGSTCVPVHVETRLVFPQKKKKKGNVWLDFNANAAISFGFVSAWVPTMTMPLCYITSTARGISGAFN